MNINKLNRLHPNLDYGWLENIDFTLLFIIETTFKTGVCINLCKQVNDPMPIWLDFSQGYQFCTGTGCTGRYTLFRSLNGASAHLFRFDICSAWYHSDSFISVYFVCTGRNNMFRSVHFRLDGNSFCLSTFQEIHTPHGQSKKWSLGQSKLPHVFLPRAWYGFVLGVV